MLKSIRGMMVALVILGVSTSVARADANHGRAANAPARADANHGRARADANHGCARADANHGRAANAP